MKTYLKKLYTNYLNIGYCKNAVKLNEGIGEDYFDTVNPHFFTGKFDSKIVMINLNPKRNKDAFNKKPVFYSFSDFWNYHLNFGSLTYGKKSQRKHKSAFDHKQVRFFKSLGVLNLKDEKSKEDRFCNLEKVLDNKLQWELIPYGSPKFDFKKIDKKDLLPYIETCVDVIAEFKRDYVLFCGSVFRNLLTFENVNILSLHNFKLIKKDGNKTKNSFQIINIEIKTNKNKIKAAILPQFAQQGAPVKAYAKKVKELYLII